MILCARAMSTSSEQRNADLAARLSDSQTWQTHFGGNSRSVQRFVGFFSLLCVLDTDWLGRQTPITWKIRRKTHVYKSSVKAAI